MRITKHGKSRYAGIYRSIACPPEAEYTPVTAAPRAYSNKPIPAPVIPPSFHILEARTDMAATQSGTGRRNLRILAANHIPHKREGVSRG